MVIQWEKYPKITGKFVTGRKKALYKIQLTAASARFAGGR